MINATKDAINTLYKLPIQKEHIDILKSNLDFLRDQLCSLEKECSELKAENTALQNIITKIKTSQPVGDFKDCGMFKLKKDNNGNFFKIPYCPRCYNPMMKSYTGFDKNYNYSCTTQECNKYFLYGNETDIEITKHLLPPFHK